MDLRRSCSSRSAGRRAATLAVATGLTAAALTASPDAAALDGPPIIPILRIGLGPAFHIEPEAEEGTELGVDVTLGLAGTPEDSFEKAGIVFSAELGYTYDGIGLHAFQFAPGIGYGHPLAYITYNPRLIVGEAGPNDDTAIGMRNGITMHVLADMGSLELGHQFVKWDGILHHDFRMVFGVNPAAFVRILAEL